MYLLLETSHPLFRALGSRRQMIFKRLDGGNISWDGQQAMLYIKRINQAQWIYDSEDKMRRSTAGNKFPPDLFTYKIQSDERVQAMLKRPRFSVRQSRGNILPRQSGGSLTLFEFVCPKLNGYTSRTFAVLYSRRESFGLGPTSAALATFAFQHPCYGPLITKISRIINFRSGSRDAGVASSLRLHSFLWRMENEAIGSRVASFGENYIVN